MAPVAYIFICRSRFSDQTCDDIAVIGAGIAGSYTAWRLREQNLSITVYEYSDRVGGRIHTVHFDDTPSINIELGAMRFIPKCEFNTCYLLHSVS